MFNRVLSIAVMGMMLALMVPVAVVKAEPVTKEFVVGEFCCAQSVRVYGDGQPRIDKESGNCVVPVTFDKDKELAEAEDPEVAFAAPKTRDDVVEEETGLLSGLETAGKSLGSLFTSYLPSFQSLKDDLKGLSRNLFDDHTSLYHSFLDEEFAEAIAMVTQYETSDELNEKLKVYDGFCRGKNPKPDCVAQRLLCSHEKYGQVLFYESGQNVLNDSKAAADIQKLLQVVQERDQALIEEAHHAERAIETAVAVYDQFFQTYRLHLRLKEMVQNLLKVKNWTGHLRTLVGCFPNKFVGVATTKCN